MYVAEHAKLYYISISLIFLVPSYEIVNEAQCTF